VTVALQDVSEEMGPTTFIPRSHTKKEQRLFDRKASKSEFLKSRPNYISTLSTGDAALYDSRCLHCGGKNRAPKGSAARILFYMTFKVPGIQDGEDDDFWNVSTIRDDIRGKFSLGDFQGS